MWKRRNGQVMSLRKACRFAYELERTIGQGVYKAICYKWHGEEVDIDELEDVLMTHDARQERW